MFDQPLVGSLTFRNNFGIGALSWHLFCYIGVPDEGFVSKHANVVPLRRSHGGFQRLSWFSGGSYSLLGCEGMPGPDYVANAGVTGSVLTWIDCTAHLLCRWQEGGDNGACELYVMSLTIDVFYCSGGCPLEPTWAHCFHVHKGSYKKFVLLLY